MSGTAHVIDTGGAGPAIIFAHGSFMDKSMFEPQISHLAARGWRCISYDSRALTHTDAVHSLGDLADDCLALAAERSLDSFVLCGMSVGAFMAIELALRAPERLRRLILIDGKAASYSAGERSMLAPRFAALDRPGFLPPDFARWLAPLCFGATTMEAKPGLVDAWLERWTTTIPARSAHRQYLSWIDKPDRRGDLGRITVPTLLFHGAEDIPTPLSHSQEMADLMPDATLVVVPGAGHTSNLEQPALVNAELETFLQPIMDACQS